MWHHEVCRLDARNWRAMSRRYGLALIEISRTIVELEDFLRGAKYLHQVYEPRYDDVVTD